MCKWLKRDGGLAGITKNKNCIKKKWVTKNTNSNSIQRFYKNEMKKIAIISTLILTTAVVFISCDSKREPGKVYMPDMAYSRAYETYAQRDTNFSLSRIDAETKHLIY